MTDMNVEELARQAGGTEVGQDDPQCWAGDMAFDKDGLERFAALVLEQAAQKCEAVAAAVPEGYVLVPVEPTEEMLQAADDGDREYTLRNFGDIQTVQQGPYDHWCAMIAAAPEVKP